jgi:hypothetical protein
MKANEFRIGNYIQIEEVSEEKESGEKYIIRDYEVIEVDSEIIRNFEENDNFLIYKYSPIPLTEEWLLKFGFEYEEKNNDYILNGGEFYVNKNKTTGLYWMYMQNCDEDACLVSIEYVHHLQNLSFALTGEELIINHC